MNTIPFFNVNTSGATKLLLGNYELAEDTVTSNAYTANFALPVTDISSPLFGLIDGTVSTPTSIFGSGLGGDASPRIIQLKGKFEF